MKRMSVVLVSVVLAMSCVSDPAPAEGPVTDVTATPSSTAAASPATTTAPAATTAPTATATTTPKPEPVRKERIEEVRVPLIVRETILFADGLVDRVITTTWDKELKNIVSTVAKKPSVPEPVDKVDFTYANGKLTRKTAYGPDGLVSMKISYEYDKDGNLTRETLRDSKDIVQSVSEYTWKEGQKKSWKIITGTNVVLALTEYAYTKNLLTEAKMLDGAGNPKGMIKYSYDTAGNLVRVEYFDSKGQSDGWTTSIFKDGLKVEESVYRAGGRPERTVQYEYGTDGALVRKTLMDGSGARRESSEFENTVRIDQKVVVYYE